MEVDKIFEKDCPRYAWTDWYSRRNQNESQTRKIVDASVAQVKDNSDLVNHVANAVKSNRDLTNIYLSERIFNVEFHTRKLVNCLSEVETQIKRLADLKPTILKRLSEIHLLLEASKEIINIRDRRQDIDLIQDEVYEKTRTEMDLLEGLVKRLQNDIDQNSLLEINLKEHTDVLCADVRDKKGALGIDRHMLGLSPYSLDRISLKPWPRETPNPGTDPFVWSSYSLAIAREGRELAEKAIQKVSQSQVLLRDADNDVRKFRELTNETIRRKLQSSLEARDELVRQRSALVDACERLHQSNKETELATFENRNNLKLIETRLEGRKYRLRREFILNSAQAQLLDEHNNAKNYQRAFKRCLGDSQYLLKDIEKQLSSVETDLLRKEQTLAIEMTCLDIHNRPSKTPYKSDIAWLSPSLDTSFVRSNIQRHIYERNSSSVYRRDNENYFNRRLLELSVNIPSLNRQDPITTRPDRSFCNHY